MKPAIAETPLPPMPEKKSFTSVTGGTNIAIPFEDSVVVDYRFQAFFFEDELCLDDCLSKGIELADEDPLDGAAVFFDYKTVVAPLLQFFRERHCIFFILKCSHLD